MNVLNIFSIIHLDASNSELMIEPDSAGNSKQLNFCVKLVFQPLAIL